ncbi:MAG: hypothetical protein HY864_08100 [Chloroflexi bacterium]|nr:hypothetical protein [Chloroflexota bacterium]
MAIEAVNLINNNHIKQARFGIFHQLYQLGTLAIAFGRNTSIGVNACHLPAMIFGILANVILLRIQAESIHLLAHRDAPIAYRT